MRTLFRLPLLGFLGILLCFCQKEDLPGSEDSITDTRDGNVYKTVKIGDQWWMAENLKYLPEVHGNYSLEDIMNGIYIDTIPQYYVYGYSGTNVNDALQSENYKAYGVLYNIYSALKVCPDGWHLPSLEEWNVLENRLGSSSGFKLQANGGWGEFGEIERCSGFKALPGGRKWHAIYGGIQWEGLNTEGWFWTSTIDSNYNSTSYKAIVLSAGISYLKRRAGFTSNAISVRCIKDV